MTLNNRNVIDHVDRIYPVALEIMDTTDSSTSSANLDLYLKLNQQGQLTTKPCDKRDHFNFPIIHFPFLDSNIPSSPTYSAYMYQFIRYSITCCYYQYLSRFP